MDAHPGSRRHRHDACGLLLALLLASGCGASDPLEGASPDPTPGPSTATLAASAEEAALVSVSNAGGRVDSRATPLPDEGAVRDFTRGLEGLRAPQQVRRAWSRADPGAGEVVVAAVVDVSCEPPDSVEVRSGAAGPRVVAVPPPAAAAEIQCLVPVTTVAVLVVPAGAA